MSDERGRTAAAWDRFTDLLAEARSVVTGPIGGRDERELAEGLRHLTRLVSVATEMFVEKGDPARPAFTRWMNPWRKFMGDNPGTVYDAAILSPALTYRIRGERGEADYLGVCVYGTGENGSRRVVRNIDTEIQYDDSGRFEVVLDGLEPDASDLLVRQYFRTDGARLASYDITAEPGAGPPPPLTIDELASRLERAGRWVRDLLEVEATLSALSEQGAAEEMRAPAGAGVHAMGEIDWDVVNRVQPTPEIHYSGGWFVDLADDEAILVEDAAGRGVRLGAVADALDGERRPPAPHRRTDRRAARHRRRDGSRSSSRTRDPGVPNWLETTGHRHGNAVFRALHPQGDVDVTFRRVRLPLEA